MSLLTKIFDSAPTKNQDRPLSAIAGQRGHYFVDKKRTTIYLSQSVTNKVHKLITKKKLSKSTSSAIENFLVALIKENS
jgi:hypothetical protein